MVFLNKLLTLYLCERERICLVVNDLPSAESKGAVPVRRGPPSESVPAHTSPVYQPATLLGENMQLTTPELWYCPARACRFVDKL